MLLCSFGLYLADSRYWKGTGAIERSLIWLIPFTIVAVLAAALLAIWMVVRRGSAIEDGISFVYVVNKDEADPEAWPDLTEKTIRVVRTRAALPAIC